MNGMNSEQLSMSFSSNTSPKEEQHETTIYEALDIQLAQLMNRLNGEKQESLTTCSLKISQHTREGQIAIACSDAQKTELLKTNVVGKAGDYKPLILDNGYLYLRRYWQYQQRLTDKIKSRLEPQELDENFAAWSKQRLNHYFNEDDKCNESSEAINWQKVAAERALKHNFLIVSGGPGTGKTTTITRILALLVEQRNEQRSEQRNQQTATNVFEPLKILLAAPTGKASIRMLDAIHEAQAKLEAADGVLAQMPKQASTIHKLLGFIPEKVGFKKNRKNPLNADVVLIDEASMIDIALMSKLVDALPAHAKLILIGDKDQLSSVETGSVFADICEGLKNSQNLVTLQKNWRFSKDSGIGQLAIAANQGNSKTLLEILQNEAKLDCSLLEPNTIAGNKIPTEFTQPWSNYFAVLNKPESSIEEIFEAFNQHRILCALRRGLNGSTIMSNRIESSLAKQGFIAPRGGASQTQNWYHGRPVMITQNSYSKGLFNGDTGICLTRKGETKVYFLEDGTYKKIAPVRLPTHETTWAMTIHKSQGSEFDHVTLVLPHEVMPLLTRQLIYTGITRAKAKLNIVSAQEVLKAGVNTEVVQATQINMTLVDISRP